MVSMGTVGVVGCGLMGAGIAQVAAQSGLPTVVREVDATLLARGLDRARDGLSRWAEREGLASERRDAALARLTGTTRVEDLAPCDLVVEAIVEDRDAKLRLLSQVDAVLAPEALLASNTSSLSITDLAAACSRPERFLGLHFFNPVPRMPLVEVIPTLKTAPQVQAAGLEFVRRLGKTPIEAADRTGFIVNRLLVPYLLDAVHALEQGHGSIADMDAGMRLGCGHPMGPFTLLDLVGLETTVAIAEIFFQEFREPRFATPPLLRRMVLAGYLGRKSGMGFYDYSGETPVPNEHLWKPGGRA